MSQPQYSFVVPVFNEEGNISVLHKEIVAVTKKIKGVSEIIFVDDGSSDGTLAELQKLKPIKILSFRRNYGQSAALDAGIKEAKGNIIITLDGDGQNDPDDVPKMLEHLKKTDSDAVCGWRKKRKDSFSKRYISKGAAMMRSFFADDGIHDAGCTLRVFKKECFEEIDLYGEMHRMIPALLRWQGFTLSELPVHHRPRTVGTSKYNWKRIFKGFIDMINIWFWRKYENRPLYFFGTIGLTSIFIGTLLGIYLAIGRIAGWFVLSDKIWPLVSLFFILFGIQLFTSGLMTNIIIKEKYEITSKMPYLIKKRIER